MVIQSNGVRVLIVDDDELTRDVVASILKQNGFSVIGHAVNGLEAIELQDKLQPDLIIMDIEMPKMDGLKAAEQISIRRLMPIIALTSHESMEFVQQASEVGIGAYLIKPPHAAELMRAIMITRARCADMIALRRQVEDIQERELRQRQMVAQLHLSLTEDIEKIHAVIDEVKREDDYSHKDIVIHGSLRINFVTHNVLFDGKQVDLSATEYAVFTYIVSQAPRVISAEELYSKAQPEDTEVWDSSEVIRYHIYRIRKKFKEVGAKNDLIRNLRGVGYTLEEV